MLYCPTDQSGTAADGVCMVDFLNSQGDCDESLMANAADKETNAQTGVEYVDETVGEGLFAKCDIEDKALVASFKGCWVSNEYVQDLRIATEKDGFYEQLTQAGIPAALHPQLSNYTVTTPWKDMNKKLTYVLCKADDAFRANKVILLLNKLIIIIVLLLIMMLQTLLLLVQMLLSYYHCE